MAIGSNPEIGTTFKLAKDYTMEDWERWWAWMRANWHPNLMAGEATLIHNTDNPYYQEGPRWNNNK
jgi:hypothetical protein